MKRLLIAVGVGALVFGLGVGKAEATAITFFGQDVNGTGNENTVILHPSSDAAQAAFLAALTGGVNYGTETFDGIVLPNPPGFLVPPFTTTLGGLTVTFNGGIVTDEVGAGRFPISGAQFVDAAANDTSGFSLTFSQPISAFGFYATDVGDFDGQLQMTTTAPSPLTFTHAGPVAGGSVMYFGFYTNDPNEAFTAVTFSSTLSRDFFGFDNVTVGEAAPVPEPASLLLLGTGLAGAAVRRYRRRQA